MIALKKAHLFIRTPLVLLTLGIGIFCAAFYEHQLQKDCLHKAEETYQSFQKKLGAMDEDIGFLNENHQKLQFLVQRGWLIPKCRLMGGIEINRWKADLNEVHFRIEPEIIKETEGGYIFRVSRVIIEASALLDTSLYDFSEKILKNFPGMLVLHKLVVRRNALVNEPNLPVSTQNKRPSFVTGELIFDWFAMTETQEEGNSDVR